MGIRYEHTSFGPGSLVRFKNLRSHPWNYAIYRGTTQSGASGRVESYDFSNTPLGPVTLWLMYWPKYIEAATTIYT